MARRGQKSAPGTRLSDIAQSLLLGFVHGQGSSGVRAEHVLQGRVGPVLPFELPRRSDGLQPPLMHEADPVAELIGLLHVAVSYTHLRAHETVLDLVCR